MTPASTASTTLLKQFGLPTAAEELVPRLTQAGHHDALPVLVEVLEAEAEARRQRRIARLRRASRLPPGKTFATLDTGRLPAPVVQQLETLAIGAFLETATNVLAFGLPGVGKSHALSAVGHALVEAGHSVLCAPAYALVQELLGAKRDLDLPRALRKLDLFEVILLDDLGYVQQSPDEAEVLFTLLAERYERRSVMVTSNLVAVSSERRNISAMIRATGSGGGEMQRRRANHGRRLSHGDHVEIQRRVSEGEAFASAAAAVGCSTKSIQRFMARTGGMMPRSRARSPLRLSLADREELSRGLMAGDSLRQIAARLGRAVSTVSREVAWNGHRDTYRAWQAEKTAARRARRPKPEKWATHPRLCREVERRLLERWSPQQIAARLVCDYPEDLEMRVSHETIYRSLFVQARGALRKELTTSLRTGRTPRRTSARSIQAPAGSATWS